MKNGETIRLAYTQRTQASALLHNSWQPQRYLQQSGCLHGQSITDSCIAWEETEVLLEELAEAVRSRRG